ncbi:hypothetical protein PV783_11425 [Chitinophaga sp. CC14]|uniref:hypothetical protein n=1 Tax=Chitinophaga sp. CC14 TaxID=3029199 RepID=UPI003B78D1D9
MKKLLLGTIVLLAFNAAVIITQMSCRKESMAQAVPDTSGLTQQNTILLYLANPNSNVKHRLMLLDYTGKPKAMIAPFEPPVGETYVDGRLSPDGKMIFFSTCITGLNGAIKLYSMKVDGSEMKEIYSNKSSDNTSSLTLEGAY